MKYETPASEWLITALDVIMASDEAPPDSDKDTEKDDGPYFGDLNDNFIHDGWHDLLG